MIIKFLRISRFKIIIINFWRMSRFKIIIINFPVISRFKIIIINFSVISRFKIIIMNFSTISRFKITIINFSSISKSKFFFKKMKYFLNSKLRASKFSSTPVLVTPETPQVIRSNCSRSILGQHIGKGKLAALATACHLHALAKIHIEVNGPGRLMFVNEGKFDSIMKQLQVHLSHVSWDKYYIAPSALSLDTVLTSRIDIDPHSFLITIPLWKYGSLPLWYTSSSPTLAMLKDLWENTLL